MLYYDYFILSSVCILPLVCILAPVCSLQSAFCTEWKFTEKELKVQATKEQVIIEGIKPSNTRPVCKCIYWRENQNKIAVQLSSTVPLETMGPFAGGKTSSLPNVIAANSPRWDENRNRGKDESNRKPR